MKNRKQEYIRTNQQWLVNKSNETGVQTLPKGIYYKILRSGSSDGLHPTARSIVTVYYAGWTIDGQQFDSNRGDTPLAIRLSDLIEGWRIALSHMRVGDKWEIYLPAEVGYGKFSQPGIPAHSTLIFEIELIGIA